MAVYAIGHTEAGPLKIGFGKSPRSRLSSLQIGSHVRLSILYEYEADPARSEAIEKCVHGMLIEHAIRGEWFKVNLATAKRAIKSAPVEILRIEMERKQRAIEATEARRNAEIAVSLPSPRMPATERIVAMQNLLAAAGRLEKVGLGSIIQGLSSYAQMSIDALKDTARAEEREMAAHLRKKSAELYTAFLAQIRIS